MSHQKNGTLGPKLDALPTGFRPIPLDIIFKVKRNGSKKARAIIKGFHMTEGIDYNDTFSPVPCVTTIRLLLGITSKYDWEAWQGDVHTAFLAADMDVELYVSVPSYFTDKPNKEKPVKITRSLHRLNKNVPGSPQGPRLWHKRANKIIAKYGMIQCMSEFCLYYCNTRKLYVVIWVDDIFMFFPTVSLVHATTFWKHLQSEMELSEPEDIQDCLGCMVKRDRPNRTLTISQGAAIDKLVSKLHFEKCSEEHTPMAAGLKLTKQDCPDTTVKVVMRETQLWYRSALASTIYFSNWTRPDISYCVGKLCKYMHNPGEVHITALKRLIRYLATTSNYGLRYDFSPQRQGGKTGIYGYYDASHADCVDTLKSTLAYIYFFESCPISWHTKLHSLVTTSTNHSEYCAAAKAAKEAKWLEKIALAIQMPLIVQPIDLFSDSKGSIAMAYNPVNRTGSKHIDLADHYAREQQERGTITITHVNTQDMIADILTKPLGRPAFSKLRSALVSDI